MLRNSLSQLSMFVAALLAAAALVGCAPSDSTEADSGDTAATESASGETETVPVAINANCPIGGEPVVDDGGRTDWNGKTVGFCCPGCITAWDELSDEDKATKLAEAGTTDDAS